MDLCNRGLEKLGLVESDGLNGIEDTLASIYSGTAHQCCVVHLQRNIINYIKASDK